MPKKQKPYQCENTFKQELHRLLTTFEECVSDAITLNAAVMVMINNERFADHNFELVSEASVRLRTARDAIRDGYALARAL